MGNEQSVPAPRRPLNKLSKPRTNNNSSANLLNTKSVPPTRHNSIISATVSSITSPHSIVPILVPKEEKKEEKQRKRRSLFRSKSVQPKRQYQDAQPEFEDFYVDPPSTKARRWSRQPRAKEWVAFEPGDEAVKAPLEMRPPPLRKRMSLSQLYGHTNPRLSLVAELPSPKPEQADTLQRLSGYEVDDMVHKSISRNPSGTQLYVPIRRKSLLQHGVATRTSYVQEVPQLLPPQPRNVEEFDDYHYNSTEPASPLSQIPALQSLPEFPPGPRVETPNELGHIGAFKLGSLRIMNGAASPAPSSEPSPRRAATMGHEEDYIKVGEARSSAERSRRQGLSQRRNTISVVAESKKMTWAVRAESPLRQDVVNKGEKRSQTPSRETQIEWNEDQSPMPPTYAFNPLTLDIPDPSYALFDFNTTETLIKPTATPSKSLELAQQDLALSPFSFDNSPPVSPTISKDMVVEDDLFAPEPSTPVHSERFSRSFDSARGGGLPARTVKGPRDLTPKPLAKADSGYSSNASLRSFKKEAKSAFVEEPLPTQLKDTFQMSSSAYSEEWTSRVSSSTYSVVSTGSEMTLRAQRSLPALPVEAPPPGNPPREPKRKSAPPNPKACQESPASDVSSTSPSWTSKMLNKRPQSMQPGPVYTVQAFHTRSEQLRVPAPSVEARRRLEERVGQFPVASIPNTYVNQLGMRRSSSKETLGTIFSVGSAEVREELSFARLQSSLPAVPKQPTIPEDPMTNLFHRGQFCGNETYQRPYDNELPRLPGNRKDLPTSSLASRSEFDSINTCQAPFTVVVPVEERTRKSMQPTARERSRRRTRTQAEFESHITSFDGASISLGQSPYDAAVDRPKSNAALKQERAMSMTAQFEADAVGRFARQRSISQESNSIIIRSRKSYDSIATGNPYLEQEIRSELNRGRPPQAHDKFNDMKQQSRPSLLSIYSTARREPLPANGHIGEQFGGLNENTGEEPPSSISSFPKKTRFPPPVSMTTQLKITPAPLYTHTLIPPSRTPPMPSRVLNRAATQPPAQFVPKREQASTRGPEWSQPGKSWAEQRKSAGEAIKLHSRKGMENRQPETEPELRSKKSLDAYTYSQQQAAQQAPKPELCSRKNMDAGTYQESMNRDGNGNRGGNFQRPALNSRYRSFDTSQGKERKVCNAGTRYEDFTQNPRAQPSSIDGTGRTTMPYQAAVQGQFNDQSSEYDHTYGTSTHPNKENIQHEYYDQFQPHSQSQEHTNLSETIHQRQSSTSEMLVLDRFAGDLDYGYEAGEGLGGSARMKHTGKMAAGRLHIYPAFSLGTFRQQKPRYIH